MGNSIHNVVNESRRLLTTIKDVEKVKKEMPSRLYNFFGDSKVTRMLADPLSTTWCTTFIGCISPTEYHYLETMDTLENLRMAGLIQTFPVRGDVETEASKLYRKIAKLESMMPPDTLAEGHPKTEMQEKLDKLKHKFELIAKG